MLNTYQDSSHYSTEEKDKWTYFLTHASMILNYWNWVEL